MAEKKQKNRQFASYLSQELPFTIKAVALQERQMQSPVMPTGEQIRAARAWLNWTVQELANRAGCSWQSVRRAEAFGEAVPRMHIATLEKIKAALEEGGIEFLQTGQRSLSGGPGIRKKQ